MYFDASDDIRQMTYHTDSLGDIQNLFDEVTYYKCKVLPVSTLYTICIIKIILIVHIASAVLRMMQNALTADTFQKALISYLKEKLVYIRT